MKKITILFIALFAFYAITNAQTVAIPDSNFEQALIDLGIDTNGVNNSVLLSDIQGVTTLNVSNKNISDLSGIEGFTALTNLRCNNNNLTTLDVSQNTALILLRCFANELTSLDVSENTALIHLQCQGNQLTSLNVQNGNNSNFIIFIANVNPPLTCIQVDDVTYSTVNWTTIDDQASFNLDCSSDEELTYIPDSNFEQALIDLEIDTGVLDNQVPTANIQFITDLDVSGKNISDLTGIEAFESLIALDCSNNQLSEINLTQNYGLTTLYCVLNDLTSLNLSQNILLDILDCSANDITDLNLSHNTLLTNLECTGNQLTSLNVDQNILLNSLTCSANQLSTINLDSNPLLNELNCTANQITELNLSQNTALTELQIGSNLLTSLDLNESINLSTLSCGNNQFLNIDVTQFSDLSFLDVSDNQLTSLDVSQNPLLAYLNCTNNDLNMLNLKNGNNTNLNFFSATDNPYLFCIEVEDVNYSEANWTNIDTHANFSEECEDVHTLIPDENFEQALISLGHDIAPLDGMVPTANINTLTLLLIQNRNISDLTGIEDFAALQQLDCSNNQLVTMDLSSNTALTGLYTSNNQLVALNLKNGHTSSFEEIITVNNPSLLCIEVDDAAYATLNLSDDIDIQTFYSEDCSIEQTFVPDDNFEQALIDLEYDSGPLNNYVPTANINTVTSLDVANKNIEDLTGIEDFEALTNLNCHNNNLSTLLLNENTFLTDLDCSLNELTDLNLSLNPHLEFFHAGHNQLTSINLINNLELKYIGLANNQITSLNVNQNTLLEHLNVTLNQITSIDLSQNSLLFRLDAGYNQLSSLELSQNLLLEDLRVYDNQLTSLELSLNSALSSLIANNNSLTSLNVKNGNNINLLWFESAGNPNLDCIEVDNVAFSTTNWTYVDAQTIFSEDCSTLNLDNLDVESSISIYPNPASEVVHIQAPNYIEIDTVELVNIAGKSIKTSSSSNIDVSQLASGFYFLKINFGNQSVIKKLLID